MIESERHVFAFWVVQAVELPLGGVALVMPHSPGGADPLLPHPLGGTAWVIQAVEHPLGGSALMLPHPL